jgi:hypothetical protein
MGVQPSHSLNFALHLEGLNLLVLMELGDFIFFYEIYLAKIRVHQDLHIHRWIFI